jgi:DNA-binding NtrC family response regulator
MAQLIAQMIDGKILLDEAVEEFEKVYIQQALKIHGENLSKTAAALGIHRNTLSKRVASYNGHNKVAKPVKKNGKRVVMRVTKKSK